MSNKEFLRKTCSPPQNHKVLTKPDGVLKKLVVFEKITRCLKTREVYEWFFEIF
jgi:hypothetical protein